MIVTDKKPNDRGAVLQMEIDVDRFVNVAKPDFSGEYNESAWGRIYHIIKTAAADTIRNGGTLVLVREGKTITLVQRPKGAA
jgi:hypothetical protein